MQPKTIASLLVLAVLGGAAIWALQSETFTAPAPVDIDLPSPETDGTTGELQSGKTTPAGPGEGSGTDLNRESIEKTPESTGDSAQGFAGRVVNEAGMPVQGATVYLVPGVSLDTIALLMRHHRGERFPPLAQATSGQDGRFRVGLRRWKENQTVELRVLHEDYADTKVERLKSNPRDWTDLEDIKMKHGVRIYGMVLDQNGIGISGATVTARPQNANGMISVPGREFGVEVKTSESGSYELGHLDRLDVAGLSAHARGHTRVEKSELQLQTDSVQIDFQLEEGFEIGGIVADAEGKPIRGAEVSASALSQKAPQQEKDYTDAGGNFLVTGLRDGQYRISVNAEGYLPANEQPVAAAQLDLKIVLEKLGAVWVTVRNQNGPLTSYTCNLKPVLRGGTASYGKPMARQDVRNAKDGRALITGARPAQYVAEILAKGYAKNFSPAFTLKPGQVEPAQVEVTLNQGGAFRGVVQDKEGKPLAGVAVSTMPNDLVENPLITAFGGAPYTITRGNTKTNSKGAFEFRNMHPGRYQLKFTHTDFCTAFLKNNVAELDQTTTVPAMTLQRGCRVSGIARLSGKPASQVKVTLSAVPSPDDPTPSPFNTEATTDNEGLFLLPKRVPPGQYKYRAAQMSGGPFHIIMQLRKETMVTIPEGRERFELFVDVPVLQK